MKLLALITVFFIVLAHPVIARHHTKVQGEPSKSEQSYKNATRAYRVGDYATTLMYLRPLAEQKKKLRVPLVGCTRQEGVCRGIMAFIWYDQQSLTVIK